MEEVKTAFNNACAAAGIEDFTFHDLRRTGATRLAEAGADAFYIQALLLLRRELARAARSRRPVQGLLGW